ncbi:hypothetical protein [Rhizobium sp. Root1220]|uniref:hypothetical protein n=1 Tax=Rhizobium sp. Root1220 TaxID=1736432 RepID=UPI0006FE60B5|nr:hypothetical protein [Rhizobium sp. Root1220]KQV70215.1 hypothetical protein ASC90_08795 [Rhizobium sp. Root1220]
MNRVLNVAVVAAISSLAFAGVSRADTLTMNDSFAIEHTLRTFDNGFNVKYEYNAHDQQYAPEGPQGVVPRSPRAIENIQASIDTNKALVRRLDARGVNVDNIINAEQAADGSMTFYVH